MIRHLHCVSTALQVFVSYNNVAALTILAAKQSWETGSISSRVSERASHYCVSCYTSPANHHQAHLCVLDQRVLARGARAAVCEGGDGGADSSLPGLFHAL